MQIHVSIDPSVDSPDSLRHVAAMIGALGGSGPLTDPQTGSASSAKADGEVKETPVPGKATTKPKANGKAAAKKVDPEPEPESEEEEEDGTDYNKLRLEIRTRFAAYAEEVGTAEGKKLLDEFKVVKFSELDNSQLAGFSKRLARLEAEQ
jgi:hypothetical protein